MDSSSSRGIIVVAFALLAACWCNTALAQAPGLALNEDNSHFFGFRSPDDMTIAGLDAFVDQYASTRVSRLFLNPNAMRASYASNVIDRIWDVGGQKVPAGNDVARRWVDNARLLYERGLDPYAVWIARCREKGISPWLTVRMNDVHDVDDTTNFMHSTFWLNHPDFWRVPGSKGAWTDRALDYGWPEVRERSMALIRELLERYDPDGIELDWMRFGYHFQPGHEAEGRLLLDAFMRDVRALASERATTRGHAIKVGARVPSHPDAAVGLGMDGVTWAIHGYIDMLVPTPFWATSDFDIPIELWKARIGSAAGRVEIAAGDEILLRGHPGGAAVENDIESARGFAASAWQRGADSIYLFNYMDPAPMVGGREAYRTLLERGLGPETVNTAPRRHVVTYRDTVPAGVSNGAQLPAKGFAHPHFQIHIGPAPVHGTVVFVAGLEKNTDYAGAAFDVSVNGSSAPAITDLADPKLFPRVVRAMQFDCPLASVKTGYNVIDVTQRPGGAEQTIVWVELRIVPAR